MTENTSNLIFLDFDGVCNTYKDGSYITNPPELYGYSKPIINKLKNICEKTNSKIIISSNWRRWEKDGKWPYRGYYFQNPLPRLYEELSDLIIGTLPLDRHITKAEALILWFEDNKVPKNWVIIDDDPTEELGITTDYNIKDHYIQTKSEFGLTEEIEKKIIEILS